MNIKELTKKIDSIVKKGSIDPNSRIELLDEIGILQDQIFDLEERLSELPEIEEEEV